MSTNYLIQKQNINEDFISTMFAMYMSGEWQVQVGGIIKPIWYSSMMKQLLDYQELCSVDCDSEYFIASQGHIAYNCCPAGSVLTPVTVNNCCPIGYTLIANIGCTPVAPVTGPVLSPIACPCCPDGYTWNSSTNICQGITASDVAESIDCPQVCIDTIGNTVGFIQCPTLVPDSILLSVPGLEAIGQLCYETMVTPWTGNC